MSNLLLDMGVASRDLELNPEQKILWENAIEKTKGLSDITTGTKNSFKKIIIIALDNENASFLELQNTIIIHFYGKLQETVQGHFDIAVEWAKLDDSLTLVQRKIFRTRVGPAILSTFKEMTDKSEKSLALENLDSNDYAIKLGYILEQRTAIRALYLNELFNIQETGRMRAGFVVIIEEALSNPAIPFLEIPNAMRENFSSHKKAIKSRAEYTENVFNILNEVQRIQYTNMVRGKLKILQFFLSK